MKLGGRIVRGCAQAIKFLATIPMKREGGYFCCAVSLHAFQFLSLSEAKGFERCADPPHPLFLMDYEPKMPLGLLPPPPWMLLTIDAGLYFGVSSLILLFRCAQCVPTALCFSIHGSENCFERFNLKH